MPLNKLIVRVASITLGVAVLLFGGLIALFSLFCPQKMMRVSYRLGFENVSVDYAYSAYKKTKNLEYLAFAGDVSYESGDYKDAQKYEQKLVANGKFGLYAAKQDEKNGAIEGAYLQYAYGVLSCSLYKNGKKAQAVETAETVVSDYNFPRNNALASVYLLSLRKNDQTTANGIKTRLGELKTGWTGDLGSDDYVYLCELFDLFGTVFS